jgi:hypothetical protein
MVISGGKGKRRDSIAGAPLALIMLVLFTSNVFAQAAPRSQFSHYFIDKTGKLLFKVDLADLSSFSVFSEGLCKFAERTTEVRAGYIDRLGRKVIPAKFADAHDFHEGRAAVQISGAGPKSSWKWGFIDHSGKMVIDAQYCFVDDFSDGLALVRLEPQGPVGYINVSGKFVIAPTLSTGGKFSEDLAGVKEGYIDKSGQLKIFSNRGGGHPFSCGLAVREVNSLSHRFYGIAKDGLVFPDNRMFGYIDRTGRFVILPHFLNCRDFSEDRAVVEMPVTLPPDHAVTGAHGCYGFIDSHGAVVTMVATHDEPHKFSNGLAAVRLAHGWAYLNKQGHVAFEIESREASDFSDGLAAVDGGYIDLTGNLVIKTDAMFHGPFSEGMAAVTEVSR